MKKNILTFCCATLSVLLYTSFSAFAQGGAKDGVRGADSVQNAVRVTGGFSTLYARDPLSQTLCFKDGQEGLIFQNNEVRNRCSDINFTYYPGSFTVGVEGARLGTIVDLGNVTDLEQRYGYEETAGNGQGFASLRLDDGKILVLKDRKAQTTQELRESAALFQEGKSAASAPIKLGDIYLVRITDHYDKSFQRVVKLIVIAYTPNESVTIRWQVL